MKGPILELVRGRQGFRHRTSEKSEVLGRQLARLAKSFAESPLPTDPALVDLLDLAAVVLRVDRPHGSTSCHCDVVDVRACSGNLPIVQDREDPVVTDLLEVLTEQPFATTALRPCDCRLRIFRECEVDAA